MKNPLVKRRILSEIPVVSKAGVLSIKFLSKKSSSSRTQSIGVGHGICDCKVYLPCRLEIGILRLHFEWEHDGKSATACDQTTGKENINQRRKNELFLLLFVTFFNDATRRREVRRDQVLRK